MTDERSNPVTADTPQAELQSQQEYLRSLAQKGESSPEVAPVAEDSSVQQAQAQQTLASQAPSAKDKESNLRIMRENAERAARERDDALKRIAQYEQMFSQQQQRMPQEASQEPEFTVPDNDDLVDNRTVAKLSKSYKNSIMDVKKQNQLLLDQIRESQFKSEHPDWQKVMSDDNIKTLGAAFPEVAKTILCNPDRYEQAKSTYTMLKRFGIYEENPYEQDKNRALENMSKPRPSASVSPHPGASPVARANAYDDGLSEDMKKRYWKEMQQLRRGSL